MQENEENLWDLRSFFITSVKKKKLIMDPSLNEGNYFNFTGKGNEA